MPSLIRENREQESAVAENEFIPLNIAVLIVSDSRTEKTDKSGKLLQARLQATGHNMHEKSIVIDDIHQIRAQVALWTANDEVNAILTTGGTGVTGRDGTPEAISVLFEKEIEGFGEMFRMLSYEEIGTSALQSRAIAGVSNATYIFCLPGSSGACATAWDKIISQQLDFRTRPCNLVELMPRLKEK
jgi:molybdenum cofactor biosynthesis protein B